MAELIKIGNSYDTPVREYICDTEEEFEQVIKLDENIPIGSTVYIIEKQITLIKCINTWVVKSTGGSSQEYEWAHSKEGF